MTTRTIKMLRNLPFLEGVSPDVVEQLAEGVVERSFQPGQVVLQEGSTGREMYLIVEGLVEVVKRHGSEEMVLAQRSQGDLVGEMGLIEARPRFATIRVLRPTRLLEFPEHMLRSVLVQQPLILNRIVRMISARLRESDQQMIANLQRKNQELVQAYRELQEAQSALVEKERLEHELELARRLQQSILPHEFPHLPGFSCAARNRPARQVGGDFYDVILLDKGRVGLVVADVSGKGMAAALYMAIARSLIRAEAKRSFSPRQVLLRVHRLLLEVSQTDMFITVFYGVFDPVQGILRYARAGHDPPLLFSPSTDKYQFLEAHGTLLGLVETVSLEEATVGLCPNDFLVLYTDGITDANSPAGDFFDIERLREMVCAASELSAQDLCDLIFGRVEQFQAEAVQFDDMALLVVKADAVD
jgi:sigma-B regulation protein RsbU (phosphoserine phosphatase)